MIDDCPKCSHPRASHFTDKGQGEYQCWAMGDPYTNERCGCMRKFLSLEKIREVKTILTHADCSDGMASALFLKDALPNAELVFLQHGTEKFHSIPATPNMLFCDIVPPPDRVDEFIEAGAIVLDHHKKAQSTVEAFGPNGVFADEEMDPGVSGGALAYREVWKPLMDDVADKQEKMFAERLAHLIGVRDTWQRTSTDWDEACVLSEALRFYQADSWLSLTRPFRHYHQNLWDERLKTGQMIFNRNKNRMMKAVEKAYVFSTTLQKTKVLMFQGLALTSDAAEYLHDSDIDLVVGFGYMGVDEGEATLTFSTRSHRDFDCGAFCTAHGGGGHTRAAGFTMKFNPLRDNGSNPYSTFRQLLDDYEAQNS